MENKDFIVYDWTVDEDDLGIRIDRFLSEELEDYSRTQIQQLIKDEKILVNNKPVKANYKLSLNDQIEVKIEPPKVLNIDKENIPLEIVYQDRDVAVVNKPRGMVVHPAPGNYSGTLVNALLYHLTDLSGINGIMRPGIVHRIDKDTSGLLVVAKNDKAHEGLAKQFKEHSIERIYVALVHGLIPHDKGTIDAPIGRDPKNRLKMTVTYNNSKNALTHFVVIERFTNHTLIECKLETGRTHQIRVHMQYIGYPLVGDPVYGSKKEELAIAGQALHAKTLGFTHPTTLERLTFTSDLPNDFLQVLQKLRENH